MRIRGGFVSNSSSSSFIIPCKEYSSVLSLAKRMIPSRDWGDSDDNLIRKINESEIRGMDKNTSVCFNSCNYETYIVKYKDYYLISTCNNHDWCLDGTLGYFPKELKELVSTEDESQCDSESFEELENVVSKLSSFWYPEYGVGGTRLHWGDTDREKFRCSKHYSDIIRVNGLKDPVCVECYSDSLRKEVELKKNKKFSTLSLFEKISFIEDKVLKIDGSLSKSDKKKIFNTLEEVKRKI